MRKLFTWFFSILMLICIFGFHVSAIPVSHWDRYRSVPVVGGRNVNPADIKTQFVVAFDDVPEITDSGGTMAVYKDSVIVRTIPVNHSNTNVQVLGNMLVITHGIASFSEETDYSITLSSDAVTVDGNSVGIAKGSWRFTTGDFTAPQLMSGNSVLPVGNHEVATMDGTPFDLKLIFNEDIMIGKGNIAVYRENGTVVEIVDVQKSNVVVVDSLATVAIPAAARFLPETKYYVRVAAGAFTDDVTAYGDDAIANKYEGIADNTTWTFTTRDTSAPEVTMVVTDVTASTAKLNITLSEAGSVKWYVGTANPLNFDAFTTVSDVAANTTVVVSVPATGTMTGGTTYYAYVAASNSEDPADETTLAEVVAAKVEFVTEDSTGPVLESRGTIEEEGITTGAFMSFDEEVTSGTGKLSLRKKWNNQLVAEIDASAVTSIYVEENADWKVILDFGIALESDVDYYIVFPVGFITDRLGNKFEDVPARSTDWVLVGNDYVEPVVSFSTDTKTDESENDIAEAGNGDNIYIHFDEEVFPLKHADWNALGTDDSEWTKYVALKADGVDLECEFSYDTSRDWIVVNPYGLASNTDYTVILRDGVVRDENGNLAAGKTITVTTGDNDTPGVTFGPDAELVENTPLAITFNKAVRIITDGTALTSANISGYLSLKEIPSDHEIAFTAAYSPETFTITVTPDDGFPSSLSDGSLDRTYSLTLLDGLEDTRGTVIPSSGHIYTVSDYKAPAVGLLSGNIEVSDIQATNATIIYNEVITPVFEAGSLTPYVLKAGAANGVNLPFDIADIEGGVALVPPAAGWDWEVGKTYYYGVGSSVTDGAGNMNEITYQSFTIVADSVINAVSYTINGGAETAIDVAATNVTESGVGGLTLEFTFDQPIVAKTISGNYVTFVGGSTGMTDILVNAGEVSGSNLSVSIPDFDIESATEYTVTLPEDLIAGDLSGGGVSFPFKGISVTLKSKDTDVPVMLTTTPQNTADEIALDWGADSLTLTFSEPVVLGTGSITITPAGGTSIVIPVNAETVRLDTGGLVARVVADDLTQYYTDYTIAIASGTFRDTSGNAFAGDNFGFTTKANPQPVVTADGLYPANNSDLAPLHLDLSIEFTEPVEPAGMTGSSGQVYVIEDDEIPGGSIINSGGTLLLAGNDSQVYAADVAETEKITVSGNMVTIKNVALEADKQYYVLITPAAFKDQSEGNGDGGLHPVAGEYEGISAYGAWSFNTGDVNQPEITLGFTKSGADGLAAVDTDIEIIFSKPVVKANGVAVSDEEVSTLITLTKDPDGTPEEIDFTAIISADKKTITIDNTSLIPLGALEDSTDYIVSFEDNVFKIANTSINVVGWNSPFLTSDYNAPIKPSIAFTGDEADAVGFNADVHTAELTLTAESADAVSLYYLWTADLNAELTARQIMTNGKEVNAADSPKKLIFDENMTSGTTYRLVAVAVDAAGNISETEEFTYTTDDVVPPELAEALPATFGSTYQLSLVFSEDVKPVTDAYARIIDANGISYSAGLIRDAENGKRIIINASGLPISADVADYMIELDPGMIVDVPRITEDNAGANGPNAFAGILGNAFSVSSIDKTPPVLISFNPLNEDVALNQSFTLTFSEAVNLSSGFGSLIIYNDNDEAYDIVTAENISGEGTSRIVVSPTREIVSQEYYYMDIPEGSFEDLKANRWVDAEDYTSEDGRYHFGYRGRDEIGLEVKLWKAANDQADVTDWTNTPASLSFVPTKLGLSFGDDVEKMFTIAGMSADKYFLDENHSLVNTYELKDHLYLKEGNVNIDFEIEAGNYSVSIIPSVILEKEKTYTFGYTNLYDVNGNLSVGEETSFSIEGDAPDNVYVTFIPGDNDGNPDTEVNITTDQVFTVEFNGTIFSYHATDQVKNNQVMTAGLLEDLDVFTLSPGTDLEVVSCSEVGGVSVVTLQAAGALQSKTKYTLTLNDGLIQIGQGHNPLGSFAETFMTADIVAPGLISENGDVLPAAYLPLNGGVVGKSETLALIFDEEVAGAGSIQVHRWDGTLVAAVDITGVESKEVDNGWKIELIDLEDAMAQNAKLVINESYYVIVPYGAIVDMAAAPNAYAGITAINEWKFTLDDDGSPGVTFVQNGKTDVMVNAPMELTFGSPVNGGESGWFAVYEEDGDAVALIRIPPAAAVTNVTTYAFDLPVDLMPNTTYYAELGAGSFISAVGVASEQVEIGEWQFTTEVDEGPLAVRFQPAHEEEAAFDVLLTTDLVITFDQVVAPGTGNIQLHSKEGGGTDILSSFNVADPSQVVFNGMTVTIPHRILGLEENSEYYVIVPATAIRNNTPSPEYFAGVTVPLRWSFSTVEDGTGPMVEIAAAEDPQDQVFSVVLTFSEAVNGVADAVSVDPGTVQVTDGVDGDAVYMLSITADEQVAVTLTVGAGLTDLNGNAMAAVARATFSVGDFTSPTVIIEGEDDPQETTFSAILTFSEAVNGVADAISVDHGTVEVTDGFDGDAIYTLSITAEEQVAVSLTVGTGVVDLGGNALAEAAGATFTVGDFTAPILKSYVPEPGTTLEDNHAALKIVFDEEVICQGGHIYITRVGKTIPTLTLPLSEDMVDGATLTVPYDYDAEVGGLNKNTEYYVTVDAGVIKDKSGNVFAGISDPDEWTFTTGADFATDVPDPFNSSGFKVYPNPFDDHLTIDHAEGLSRIIITNIAGQRVKEVTGPTSLIQTGELRSGIYFVTLITTDEVVDRTIRIIKK